MTTTSLLAQGLINGFTGEIGKQGWSAVQRILSIIRDKFSGDAEGQAALTLMEADPQDSARIELLARLVQAHGVQDSDFRSSLIELSREATSAGIRPIIAKDSGLVAGGNVMQLGEVNIGRDQVNYDD
jgi:hypothetical protein